jgi:DNA polymerase III subunit beta
MNEEVSIKEGAIVDIKASLVLEKLKAAMAGVERVVNSRSALPILNHVLIKADSNGVELAATDLEIGVRFFLGGKVEQEGAVTVPGRTLISLINSLRGETVALSCRNNILTVVCGESRAKINSLPADEFPVIPQVEGGQAVKMRTSDFRDLVSQVDFAASRDESRPILTGVAMTSDGSSLTLAATDSFRLSESIASKALGAAFSVVVPAKTLQEAKRSAGDAEETEMRVGDTQVMFVWPHATLVSKILEGEYPNYKQIIPKEHTTRVEVDVSELLDLLKTASVFSLEVSNNVKLVFGDDSLEVTSESSQVGNFNAKIPATVEGDTNEISFNVKYLIDGLSSFDTPRCVIEATTKTAAGVFRPTGEEGRLYLVMPLRS